jgi:hypothetical protein
MGEGRSASAGSGFATIPTVAAVPTVATVPAGVTPAALAAAAGGGDEAAALAPALSAGPASATPADDRLIGEVGRPRDEVTSADKDGQDRQGACHSPSALARVAVGRSLDTGRGAG